MEPEMPTSALRICCFALPIALCCATPVDDGQGGGPPPSALTRAPPKPSKTDLPACGNRAVMARFRACKEAASKLERAPCEAAGGIWGTTGLHNGCNCPTGQGGCPCTGPGDCLGVCLLHPGSRECPASPAEATWRCSSHHDVVGCNCRFIGEGMTMSMCAD
jgi:hypothetical protein